MPDRIILASTSQIRSKLLDGAGVSHDVVASRIDEDSVKKALEAEGAPPRDIADTLAEMKARKIAEKGQGGLVIGCDQVLSLKGKVLSKPKTIEDARGQLNALRGETHQLLSAAVIYEDLKSVWRHVGVARLSMRDFSDDYCDDYLARNWDSIRWAVGGYKIEEEGIRLFRMVQGDTFTIQGLPLLELLSYLTLRGTLPT